MHDAHMRKQAQTQAHTHMQAQEQAHSQAQTQTQEQAHTQAQAHTQVMFSRRAHQRSNILAALAHDHPLEGVLDHQILNLTEGQAERESG